MAYCVKERVVSVYVASSHSKAQISIDFNRYR